MFGIFKGLLPDIKSFLNNDKKKHEQVHLNIDKLKEELEGADKYSFTFDIPEDDRPKIQLFHETVHIRDKRGRKLIGEEDSEEESKELDSESKGFPYNVELNDTLFGLSLKYNVRFTSLKASLQAIKHLNSFSTESLFPGQVCHLNSNRKS